MLKVSEKESLDRKGIAIKYTQQTRLLYSNLYFCKDYKSSYISKKQIINCYWHPKSYRRLHTDFVKYDTDLVNIDV